MPKTNDALMTPGRTLQKEAFVTAASHGQVRLRSGDPLLYWQMIVRGLRSEGCACTICQSRYVRPSRRRIPWHLRLLGLALFRCESCLRLFVLPGRFKSDSFEQHDFSGV